jgi:hypothetical protein
MSKSRRVIPTNKSAIILSRIDRTGKFRTETARRDDDAELAAAISTSPRSNGTSMYIDFPQIGETVSLNGRQARTLFRLLSAHYQYTGKSVR